MGYLMAIHEVWYANKKLQFSDEIKARVSHFHSRGRIYESRMLEFIRSLNKKGTYVDVGANIGNHSVFFDKFCKSDKVVAIEPIKQIFDVLSENIDLNKARKTTTLNIAASSKKVLLESNTKWVRLRKLLSANPRIP